MTTIRLTPIPASLPATFSYTDARTAGLSDRRLYALRDQGLIDQIGRGLFRRPDAAAVDPDLLEISRRAPEATLCLVTALARHGLTDIIPAEIDVALPRGRRHPRITAPASWHSFAADTFTIGHNTITLGDDDSIGIYDPERCLVDTFRLRHREGSDIANEALRRWLRRPGSRPTTLITMARSFPAAEPALRTALEILL